MNEYENSIWALKAWNLEILLSCFIDSYVKLDGQFWNISKPNTCGKEAVTLLLGVM